MVVPRRERPLLPGEPGHSGNPHTDFVIEPDPSLPVEDDLERRDFTVNAIARDLRSGEVIDPFGGRADAAARVLRAVHPSSFRDDPLRILRGVARRALDDLVPEPGTLALMREFAPAVAGLSAERVREQLDRTLEGARADDGLRLARDVGALAAAVPELEPIVGVEQRSRTQLYTLDEHMLHTLGQVCDRGGGRLVRLAALWHDVGKPFAEGVRGHAEESARRAERGLRRLTYDNETIRAVCHLVREHSFGEDREPSALGARRFLCRVGRSAAEDLLLLRRSDRAARGVEVPAEDEARRGEFERLVREQWGAPVTLGELAIDGGDLLELGYREGPALGRALRDLLDAVVEDPSRNEPGELRSLARRALEGGSTCTSAST